ncbi:MAG: Phenylacetic acid catabolic protein [Candidatus Obscuribacterales bacterium]
MKTYDVNDRLPEDYKAALIDLLSFQADSEFAGGQRVAENMRFATRPEEAYRLAKKVMEEMGHGWYCWEILAPLGVDVNARVEHLVQHPENPDPKKVRIINGFRKENWSRFFEDWSDVAMFSTVVTPAAVAFLGQYRESSYVPWKKISERIWQEEKGHLASESGQPSVLSSLKVKPVAKDFKPRFRSLWQWVSDSPVVRLTTASSSQNTLNSD